MQTTDHLLQLDPTLKNKLLQLTHEMFLVSIYHAPSNTGAHSHILIVAQFKKEMETIASRKWVQDSLAHHGVQITVVYDHQLQYGQKKGNPFIIYLCHPQFNCYTHKDYDVCYDTSWSKASKKRKAYLNAYHHDRDLLLAQSETLTATNAMSSALLAYESLYVHHIGHLEALYLGAYHHQDTLHQRIQRLSRPMPCIEGLFVKQNGNRYVLPLQFEGARTDNPLAINAELLESVKTVEEQLSQKVQQRIRALKKMMKHPSPKQMAAPLQASKPVKVLSQLVAHIVEVADMEEIYRFHRIDRPEGRMYGLLLVGKGLGTERLQGIRDSVLAKMGGTCDVLLIAHSRSWIQNNLYQHQSFFKRIMAPENRIYQSHPHHPQPHWLEPYTPTYPDMDLLSKTAQQMAQSFQSLRTSGQGNHMEGLEMLFGVAVLRLFRTLVYAKSGYLPNYLPAWSLWHLAIMGDPQLEHLTFLFQKWEGEKWFARVDAFARYHYENNALSAETMEIMAEILKYLSEKLAQVVRRSS